MAKRAIFVLFVVNFLGASLSLAREEAAPNGAKGFPLYGEDDRYDFFAADPKYIKFFKNSVALIEQERLTLTESTSGTAYWEIRGDHHGRANNLCRSERYYDQLGAAFCSGVLIQPDVVLTAGHCFDSPEECQTAKFVFGFHQLAQDISPTTARLEDVYECKEMIYWVNKRVSPDFALIRLTQKVSNREPATLRLSRRILKNEAIFAVGYSKGLPAKLANNAVVRKALPERSYFEANLDVYYNNSGSPVYNEVSGVLEGILLSGEEDFSYDRKLQCYRSKQCTNTGCKGETVMRISEILPHLPQNELN